MNWVNRQCTSFTNKDRLKEWWDWGLNKNLFEFVNIDGEPFDVADVYIAEFVLQKPNL